jgi:magnesium-transporting ATPase (P-type)
MNDFIDNWHYLTESEIFQRLSTQNDGLSDEQARERLKRYGFNVLPKGKKKTILSMILDQILNPLVVVLIFAALAAILIGESKDTLFILAVIFINTCIGTYQEYVAERNASNLQHLINFTTRVKRNGKEKEIASEQIVPGDVVLLDPGRRIPADMRLIEANELEIDESLLTGESIASQKKVGVLDPSVPVADRKNMAFAGSSVVKGRGVGVVVGTGLQTQIGKISLNVSHSTRGKPPLIIRMEKFVKQIALIVLSLGLLLAIFLYINQRTSY